MKKTRFDQMKEEVSRHFDREQGERIKGYMDEAYSELCSEHITEGDTMENHKRNNIFPVIAAYRGMLKEGIEDSRAEELSKTCFLNLMESIAGLIRKMMKIPGAYRLMPWMWKTMMPKLFSTDSGFRFSFYPTDGKQVKFDMLECPYLQICRELGCDRFAPVFCASDDVCYGNMHPKLIWNRTKTLARDGEACDFDLFIR